MIDHEAEFEQHHHDIIEAAIARLEERDQQLEDALLGDLTVNNVDGSIGSVSPAKAKQIGWSANFGFFNGNAVDSGRGDNSQDAVVTYGQPFTVDTITLLMTPILVPHATSVGFLFLESSDKNGFTVTTFVSDPTIPTPLPLCYMAVGF